MVGVVRAERHVRRRLPERRPPREVSSTKTIDSSEMWFAVRTRDDWCLEDDAVVDRTEQLGAMPLSTHTLRGACRASERVDVIRVRVAAIQFRSTDQHPQHPVIGT